MFKLPSSLQEQIGHLRWNTPHAGRKETQDAIVEAIVRHCAKTCEGGNFLHDKSPESIFGKQCADAILREFGLEKK